MENKENLYIPLLKASQETRSKSVPLLEVTMTEIDNVRQEQVGGAEGVVESGDIPGASSSGSSSVSPLEGEEMDNFFTLKEKITAKAAELMEAILRGNQADTVRFRSELGTLELPKQDDTKNISAANLKTFRENITKNTTNEVRLIRSIDGLNSVENELIQDQIQEYYQIGEFATIVSIVITAKLQASKIAVEFAKLSLAYSDALDDALTRIPDTPPLDLESFRPEPINPELSRTVTDLSLYSSRLSELDHSDGVKAEHKSVSIDNEQLRMENEHLRMEKAERESRIKEMQNKIEGLLQQIDDLKTQNEQLQINFANFKSDVALINQKQQDIAKTNLAITNGKRENAVKGTNGILASLFESM
jgi:hypothetical protein